MDSVITAVGLVEHVSIMAVAIILAVVVMLMAAKAIGDFVDTHPTIKILALSFLILVGVTLMVEGFDVHVPKRLHLLLHGFFRDRRDAEHTHARKRATPIKLHSRYAEEPRQ